MKFGDFEVFFQLIDRSYFTVGIKTNKRCILTQNPLNGFDLFLRSSAKDKFTPDATEHHDGFWRSSGEAFLRLDGCQFSSFDDIAS